jgi:7-keto-8-aminopelargonate synthetase-like enzyme
MTLVDNAFAVPGADNCGPDGSLDEVLDLDKSLPSAAGSNSAILSGKSFTAPASLIRSYVG